MSASLEGVVAVVTGASRGAGRGIAVVLGESGATVYVTARSVRGAPSAEGRSGNVEETAEEVRRRGGTAVPVRCDHTVDEDVARLFEQVRRDRGRLDLLVNNAWGGMSSAETPPQPSSAPRSGSNHCGAGRGCSKLASELTSSPAASPPRF